VFSDGGVDCDTTGAPGANSVTVTPQQRSSATGGGHQRRTGLRWSDLIQVWAPNEEDRQGEHDNPSQQTQGQAQGEAPAPASAGNRLMALVSHSGDPGRNARKKRKQSFVLSTCSKRRRWNQRTYFGKCQTAYLGHWHDLALPEAPADSPWTWARRVRWSRSLWWVQGVEPWTRRRNLRCSTLKLAAGCGVAPWHGYDWMRRSGTPHRMWASDQPFPKLVKPARICFRERR